MLIYAVIRCHNKKILAKNLNISKAVKQIFMKICIHNIANH